MCRPAWRQLKHWKPIEWNQLHRANAGAVINANPAGRHMGRPLRWSWLVYYEIEPALFDKPTSGTRPRDLNGEIDWTPTPTSQKKQPNQ